MKIRMCNFHWQVHAVHRGVLPFRIVAGIVLLFSACDHKQQPDTQRADQTAMWLDQVPDLKSLNVSNAEIGELSKAHEVGLTDPSCVALIKLARDRKIPFADGQSIADLLGAGSSEQTVLELARLNQLGIWAGQARTLRLAGFSDKIILAVAQRRSQGLPVLSGEKLGELKNSGASEATILEMIQKGYSESQASAYITQRERAAGGHGFVYQRSATPEALKIVGDCTRTARKCVHICGSTPKQIRSACRKLRCVRIESPVKLEIVQAGNPVLRQRARPLSLAEISSTEIQNLIESMRNCMREAPGVGLAAPQVGVSLQLAVIEDREEYHKDVPEAQLRERERRPVSFHVLINPTLTPLQMPKAQ